MLRMISYGNNNDPIDNRGMNTLLNSAEIPDERCVSKTVAIRNGTNETKMAEFEAANPGQSFPLNRLIPVWPIKESKFDTMCTTPYDSRNMRVPDTVSTPDVDILPQGCSYTIDSYVAGYTYNFIIPSDASWLLCKRTSYMETHTITGTPILESQPWENGYYYDAGVYFYAQPLALGQSPRATYVIVQATKNQALYDQLYPNGGGPNVCETAKLFVRQSPPSSDNFAEYTGINELTLGFSGTLDQTNTHINTAVVYEATELSGAFYANRKLYGISEQDPNYSNYSRFVTANGSEVKIDIAYLKASHPGYSTGNSTYYIYANWEGVGTTSNKVPVPKRVGSTSIDVTPNNNLVLKTRLDVPMSFGNMNIYDTNDPDSSTIRNKMCARCACVMKVVYNWATDKVGLQRLNFDYSGDSTTWEYPGIRPVFYPTTYQVGGQSGDFTWTSAGVDNASTQRTFSAISVPAGSTVTVNIYSKNEDYISGTGWVNTTKPFSVSIGSSSAASEYTIGNGTSNVTIDSNTPSTDISNGTSFTINLSDTTKYPVDSTHRFRLRQIISDSADTVSSVETHNASPEYADIAFTIVQGQ